MVSCTDAEFTVAVIQADSDNSICFGGRRWGAYLRRKERANSFANRESSSVLIIRHVSKHNEVSESGFTTTPSALSSTALLQGERQSAIKKHLAAYGPMITKIQQRLRSVYGFEGFELEAHGGQAIVHVEWRNKRVQVAPTDFFSDSQKQILMLSIFFSWKPSPELVRFFTGAARRPRDSFR
jgi:hypothetical protein